MKNIVFLFLIVNCSLIIDNCLSQWVQVPLVTGQNRSVWALAAGGNTIFAGTYFYGVYLSSNNGTSWTQTSLNNQNIYSLAVNGNNVFAGTWDPGVGVYKSTDNGTTWAQTSLNSREIVSLAVSVNNNVFAGTRDYGVYKSTDNGTTWTQTSLNNRSVYALAVKGDTIYAGTQPSGVYKSTDNGTTWTQTSLNNRSVRALAVNENYIFAGTYSLPAYGVYKSTDYGTSWTQTPLNYQGIVSLIVNGNNVFAGSFSSEGVYASNDNGTNWTPRNEGLVALSALSFCISGNYIFLGQQTRDVYRRPLGELVGIKPVSSEIPDNFSLSQNYPNPFNPTTKIKYQITNSQSKNQKVELSIYNALGEKIAILVNEEQSAGTYEVDWEANDYPSGVYYYKIVSGDFTETKKMVLIR